MDNSSVSSERSLIINLSHSNSRELDSGIQTISEFELSNENYICEGSTQGQNFDPVHQEVKVVTSCHSNSFSKVQEKVSVSCDIPDNVNFGNEYLRASTPIPGKPGSSNEFVMEFLLEDKDHRLQTNADEVIGASNEQQIGSFEVDKNEGGKSNYSNQSDLHPRNMYCIPTNNITVDFIDGKADNKIRDSALTGIQEHGCSLEYKIPPVLNFQERDLRCALTKAKIMSMITSVKNPCLIKQENQVCLQKTAIDGSLSRPQYKRYPKPPYTYLGMIVVAIENSVDKQLTLSEIHQVLREFFPFFCGEYTGWKDSVRHNLSNNRCFFKVPKDPHDLKCRHHYWRVDLEKVPPEAFRRHDDKDTRKEQYALYIHDHLGLPPIHLPSQKRRKRFLDEKRDAIDQQKVSSNNHQKTLNNLSPDSEEPCSHDRENHTDLACDEAKPLAKRFQGDIESDKRDSSVRPVISDEARLILNYISNTAITDEDTYSALQNLSWLCHSPAQCDPAVYAWQLSYYQVAGYPVPQMYHGMTPETSCVPQMYHDMTPETPCVPQMYHGTTPETPFVPQMYHGTTPETPFVPQMYNGMTPETPCVSQMYHGTKPETPCVPHGYQMLDNSYTCRSVPHTTSRDECYMYGDHSGHLPLQPSSTVDSNPLETFAGYALTYSQHQ